MSCCMSYPSDPCLLLWSSLKRNIDCAPRLLAPSSLEIVTEQQTEKSKRHPLSPFVFLVYTHGMESTAQFAALAHRDLFYEYAGEFFGDAAATAWDDTTLNSLFWLGANCHHPVDLPDTTGLSLREGVFRCLGSVHRKLHNSRSESQMNCMR